MSSLPHRLILKKGHTVLAVLTVCEPIEMFILACDFSPTEAFLEYAALFNEINDIPDNDAGQERLDEIVEILNRELMLICEDNQTYLRFWLMNIGETKAQLRWAEEIPVKDSK